ncbi:MAG: tripartite tricarboxylate transporter TctB family protein [Ruminococcaceae bacterium]|nr:tripartite tricarboxylate transporter TctB family protein [Oscillospiraceae bacterium]
MKKLSITFSLILMLFSMGMFFYADSFKTLARQKGIGPSGFPKAMCAALIVLSICLIISEVRKDNKERIQLFNTKLVIGLVSILFFFILLKPLGFILSGIFIIAVMMILLLNEPLAKVWPTVAALSVITPVALYFIFGVFLKVPLPSGLLKFLIG